MKLNLFFFVAVILSSFNAFSQNLVKNPRFDEYLNYFDKNRNLVYQPKDWYYVDSPFNHPFYFSTDRYLNKTIKQNFHPDSALINRGEIANYISIMILPNVQRAYSALEKPLLKGEKYHIDIDIKALKGSNYFADLLIGFKDTVNNETDACLYQLRLEIPDSLCFENLYTKWLTLSTDFVATGKEKVLVVSSGSSSDYKKMIDSNIDKFLIISMGGPQRLKYFIDNVSLTKTESDTDKLYTQKYDSLNVGEKVILNNIYFDFDKYELRNDSFDELNRLFTYLKDNTSIIIEVGGYTDSFGSEKYNEKLSLNRAKALTDYLVNKGISNGRLSYKGYGKNNPIDTNDTSDGRQKNRRIEILIIGK